MPTKKKPVVKKIDVKPELVPVAKMTATPIAVEDNTEKALMLIVDILSREYNSSGIRKSMISSLLKELETLLGYKGE